MIHISSLKFSYHDTDKGSNLAPAEERVLDLSNRPYNQQVVDRDRIFKIWSDPGFWPSLSMRCKTTRRTKESEKLPKLHGEHLFLKVGFQVLTAVVINFWVFWDILPCIPLKVS
jgi:hypothetical protein